MAFELQVEDEKCAGCGNCVVVCPVNSFNSVEISSGKGGDSVLIKCGGGSAYLHDPDLCNGCGSCIVACPYGAIEITVQAPKEKQERVSSSSPRLLGDKLAVLEKVREMAPVTIPELARALDMEVRPVLQQLYALKGEGKVLEYGERDGEILYSTEKPETKDEGPKETATLKVDPEKAAELRRRLEVAIPAINKVVIRSFIERDKLEKAQEKLRKEIKA
ncbi:MAG: ferredoxin family protein [Euryarchaeota archaeon]|nr:ferredoxin family protein [Euryarchaeota archaeon]